MCVRVRERGGLDRQCMYLAREGGRERELGMECNGGCVREIHFFIEWGKGVVYLRELEIETRRERMSVCQKPIAL